MHRLTRKVVIMDMAFVAGAGLAVYGCWLIYPPAAIIALGAGICLIVRGHVKENNHDRRRTL